MTSMLCLATLAGNACIPNLPRHGLVQRLCNLGALSAHELLLGCAASFRHYNKFELLFVTRTSNPGNGIRKRMDMMLVRRQIHCGFTLQNDFCEANLRNAIAYLLAITLYMFANTDCLNSWMCTRCVGI